MASHVPRSPYTPQELERLYPPTLRLEQAQIILRHGERTPVSARFQNAGLAPYWPYCNAARRFTDVIMSSKKGGAWDTLKYKRQMETIGSEGVPTLIRDSNGNVEGICQPGELTDKGRETTLALGNRLRHLYINQLNFLPSILAEPSTTIALRSTPIPRALESVQQAFHGLYPTSARLPACPTPTITARSMAEETLFPNTGACKRFNELFDLFAERAAGRWNESPEMEYLNRKIGKWMPDGEHKRIKLDGKPRISGIMDTVNASLAHDDVEGAGTKLPGEFYDETMRGYIDRMACDEWYAGYRESREYRMLGMGALLNDMTTRMIWHSEGRDMNGEPVATNPTAKADRAKLWLAGAHDTTLAGLLTSLGAFGDTPWPPFTSHVAVELFSRVDEPGVEGAGVGVGSRGGVEGPAAAPKTSSSSSSPASTWWSSLPLLSSLFPFTSSASSSTQSPAQLATTPTSALTPSQRTHLQNHFVRIRYNDRPMPLPGCAPPGRHLDGDESFCTLEAFREIVEAFAPRDWRTQCRENLRKGLIGEGGDV